MKKHGEMCWDPTSLNFKMFSTEDIKQISVCKIMTPMLFDAVGRPLPGGLYDPYLGACRNGEYCRTCSKPFATCPGHMGYIELCMTTYNPLFTNTVLNILKISCLKCFKIQVSDEKKAILDLQLTLLEAGYMIEAQELENLKMVSSFDDGMQNQLDKYRGLLAREPINLLSTSKNIQSMRQAIISTSIKDCVTKTCLHCSMPMTKVKRSYRKMVISMNQAEVKQFYEKRAEQQKIDEPVIKATNRTLFADQCRSFLRDIYANDGAFLQKLFPMIREAPKNIKCPTDIYFIDVMPVTPPNQRPVATLQSGVITVSVQTQLYQDIMDKNSVLRAVLCVLKSEQDRDRDRSTAVALDNEYQKAYESVQGDSPEEKMNNAWNALQEKIDCQLDTSHERHARGRGLKQIIEQKEGLIRKHMMGKRVNYAARTVITPDPNIGVDEIGVPEAFALKLNYPVPVTTWNVVQLRQMVINGPDRHPGACSIKDEAGKIKNLKFSDENDRISCAKTLLTKTGYQNFGVKVVHRHLLNNDVLLMNRQPTLHRPSIQAHKVRILKNEKTFRMHYSNCKAYNADFDGDEMNAHYPQNELARSEAYNLVAVPHNYLVPKDGTPLGGLIQDQVISGVKLMIRGRFFNRDDYNQLVFQAMTRKSGKIRLLPPTVWKPYKMWSGKQVISTIIINSIPAGMQAINLEGTSKIRANAWNTAPKKPGFDSGKIFPTEACMTEAEIVIRQGELVSGILDKNHYGSVAYGLVHCMYELYGPQVSANFLTSLTRLFTYFLQWEGFTLGVHDILVDTQANRKRTKIIKESRKVGHEATCNALNLPSADIDPITLSEKVQEAFCKIPNFRAILDREYKKSMDKYTNDINRVCLPGGLISKFPDNNLQLMVQSGAKGSTVNTMQISCLLGQIELEGKRPPQMISGRSLPSFPTFETSPKSGGFIDGRFMTGIQPQDFFFHCMAGREGLIDTAVKTSRSGYLQRCLIKHLEGLTVNYDLTVRDSDNSVIQFLYGEDGMDICKNQFLKEPQLPFLDANHATIVTPDVMERIENDADTAEALQTYKKKLKTWLKKHKKSKKKPLSAFQQFVVVKRDQVTATKANKLRKNTGRTKMTEKLVKLWLADNDNRSDYETKARNQKRMDPVVSRFQSDNCYGAISEYLEELIESYAKAHPERRSEIQDIVYVKSMQSLAEPGEPVGLLAAQSIGEPSTQMTLNTFHFAGRGEMNVTLGIPRLREILMLASPKIKTPSMDIPFLKQLQPDKDEDMNDITERVRIKMNRTTVADVLESVDVRSQLIVAPNRSVQYTVHFKFLPPSNYATNFCVKPKQILKHMNKKFFAHMFRAIQALSQKNKAAFLDEDAAKEKSKKKKVEKERDDYMIDSNQPKSSTGYDGHESSDEEPDENINDQDDAGATDDTRKHKQSDKHDYDDKEEGDDDEAQDSGLEDNNNNSDDETAETTKLAARKQLATDEDAADSDDETNREIEDALLQNKFIRAYKYDKKHSRWCELTFEFPTKMRKVDLTPVLRDVAAKSVIYEIPNIRRAITYKQNDEIILKTDGINIVEMFKYNQILDIRRLYSNDIHGIAKTYGIEAAARVIVKEVQNVFKVYGIVVDPRHLLLIADYMTFDGTFKSLSRIGMASSASPLQQMSFETSLKFLCEATVMAKEENLCNPSGRLMVGQPSNVGTGAFKLISDNSYFFKKLIDSN